jgi:hypothetical protein
VATKLLGKKKVNDNEELLIISTGSMEFRQAATELLIMGRNKQVFRLIIF